MRCICELVMKCIILLNVLCLATLTSCIHFVRSKEAQTIDAILRSIQVQQTESIKNSGKYLREVRVQLRDGKSKTDTFLIFYSGSTLEAEGYSWRLTSGADSYCLIATPSTSSQPFEYSLSPTGREFRERGKNEPAFCSAGSQ